MKILFFLRNASLLLCMHGYGADVLLFSSPVFPGGITLSSSAKKTLQQYILDGSECTLKNYVCNSHVKEAAKIARSYLAAEEFVYRKTHQLSGGSLRRFYYPLFMDHDNKMIKKEMKQGKKAFANLHHKDKSSLIAIVCADIAYEELANYLKSNGALGGDIHQIIQNTTFSQREI